MRVAGVEGSTGVVMDVNSELRWTGITNVLVGIFGGVLGSVSPGLTAFNQAAGSTDCKAALVTAVLTLLLWLTGLPVMNILPRFLLAGILMNLGLGMIIDWMFNSFDKVGFFGLVVVYIEVGSAVFFGLLPGVTVGIIVSCIGVWLLLFQTPVLKYHVSAQSFKSYVRYSREEERLLRDARRQVHIFGLEGYLSGGPTAKAGNYIEELVGKDDVLYVILDLSACQGHNSGACYVLCRLATFLKKHATLVYSGVSPDMKHRLKAFGSNEEYFDCVEDAVKGCEAKVLGAFPSVAPFKAVSSSGLTAFSVSVPETALTTSVANFLQVTVQQAQRIEELGDWQEYEVDQVIVIQGQVYEEIYIAAPGYSELFEEQRVDDDRLPIPIALDRSGTIFGAESIYGDTPARSTIRVVGGSHVLVLLRDDVQALMQKEPPLFTALALAIDQRRLQRTDILAQKLKLASSGGWKGAVFDQNTASETHTAMMSPGLHIRQVSCW